MKQNNWYEMFSLCSKLYDKYCHLDLSTKAVTRSGIKVGEWLEEQRQNIDKLSISQITDLNSIGMIWDKSIGDFHEKFTKYKEELAKYSVVNTDTFKGLSYVLKLDENSLASDGFNLFEWSRTFDILRKANDDRVMTLAEVRYIARVGFSWEVGFDISRDEAAHRSVSMELVKRLIENKNNSMTGVSNPMCEEEYILDVKRRDIDDLLPLNKISRYLDNIKVELDRLYKISNEDDSSRIKEFENSIANIADKWVQISDKIKPDYSTVEIEDIKHLLKDTDDKIFNRHCEKICDIVSIKASLTGKQRKDIILRPSDYSDIVGTRTDYTWLLDAARIEELSEDKIYNLNIAYPLWRSTGKFYQGYNNENKKSLLEEKRKERARMKAEKAEKVEKTKIKSQRSEKTKLKYEKTRMLKENTSNEIEYIDKLIDEYLEKANKYKQELGYIPNTTSSSTEFTELAIKLMRMTYEEFTEEQISKLEAVDFIWLHEGESCAYINYVRSMEIILKYIIENNKTVICKKDDAICEITAYSTYRRMQRKAYRGCEISKRGLEIIHKQLEMNNNTEKDL